VVFGVCKLIDLVVPDIPESLDIKIKRERFLAKEALQVRLIENSINQSIGYFNLLSGGRARPAEGVDRRRRERGRREQLGQQLAPNSQEEMKKKNHSSDTN